MYEPVTPRKYALDVYHRYGNDPQQRIFTAGAIEGKHIPKGTFNEWVHECKSMGMCIHKFAQGKSVVISGY